MNTVGQGKINNFQRLQTTTVLIEVEDINNDFAKQNVWTISFLVKNKSIIDLKIRRELYYLYRNKY